MTMMMTCIHHHLVQWGLVLVVARVAAIAHNCLPLAILPHLLDAVLQNEAGADVARIETMKCIERISSSHLFMQSQPIQTKSSIILVLEDKVPPSPTCFASTIFTLSSFSTCGGGTGSFFST